MLLGFSGGLAYILFLLIARVLAEYPYQVAHPFRFLSQFRQYWELALGGLLYNAAIWVDKWVMWFAPDSEVLASGMVSYPDYDTAMFLAYLSIVPSMAVFVFHGRNDGKIGQNIRKRVLRYYNKADLDKTYRDLYKTYRTVPESTVCVGGGR